MVCMVVSGALTINIFQSFISDATCLQFMLNTSTIENKMFENKTADCEQCQRERLFCLAINANLLLIALIEVSRRES